MFKHCPWTPAALAAALLIAPTNASAVPVPPPDIDSVEECTESGTCQPSLALFDLDPNGNIADITWCDPESEHYITFTGFFVIGHWIFIVQIGMTVCWYGECGGYVTNVGGSGVAIGVG